jgi:heparan-alpha-glucosaminide N-acetyltransferase
MLFMASEILSIPVLARQFPDSVFWRWVGYNTSHVEWTGWSLWDMIQPSFTFMVGVALPWSLESRRSKGQSTGLMWFHAFWRSFLLVALGIFLRSVGKPQTNFTFEDVLTQIGLGYPILFGLAWLRPRWQALAAAVILIGYWGAFALYPAPAEPQFLHGFAAHWDKADNFAAANDRWFMNLLPREKPFVANSGGYQTLSFVPSQVTMIFGLLAGGLMKSARTHAEKIKTLSLYGLAGIVVGLGLDAAGICPMVKRIWTPSWTLFSGGAACWILALFYWVIDVRKQQGWAFPFLVVGMNSIAMYCLVHLMDGFLASSLQTHLGWLLPAHSVQAAVLLILWTITLWMFRRKIFLRI